MDQAAAGPAGGGYDGAPGPGYGGGGAPGYGGGRAAYGVEDEAFSQPGSTLPKPVNFHRDSLGMLVVLPTTIFVSISLCYCFAYHQRPSVVWFVSGFSLCLSCLFMLAPQRQGTPRFWFNVGFLVLLAAVAANVAGQWNFRERVFLYWAYEGQREYTNVSPKEPALSHLDAGKLVFSSDAHVNVAATVGITAGVDRFCVAPIVHATGDDPRTHRIEYWAAGVNCCGSDVAREFTCDDVADQQAHAGLVFLDYGPKRELVQAFAKAARDAGAAHGITPSEDALFVSWVADPDQVQEGYWRASLSFVALESVVYAAFSLLAGLCLHFGPRSPNAKQKMSM